MGVVSRFMHDPREEHLQAANCILHYLKATPGKGIMFPGKATPGKGTTLEPYSDADYIGSLMDKRSTLSYCTFLGGNLVIWRSKKQSVVVRSSAEVKFRAMTHGICELNG